MRETGMAIVGIKAALQSWIKIKTTRITNARAINKVWIISAMPAVMARVVSRDMSYLILSGKDPDSSSIVFLTFSASSTALEPGAWYRAIMAHSFLLSRVNALYVSTPNSTRAICFIFT
ncbi:hypothetical protein ES703_74110 [subsurface metagenome]